jgi:hypothetical protein
MRRLNGILMASIVFASLYAAAGTAWARSESQRGTSWTQDGGSGPTDQPGGASWERFNVGFLF